MEGYKRIVQNSLNIIVFPEFVDIYNKQNYSWHIHPNRSSNYLNLFKIGRP